MSAITNALKKALEADPENWETRHGLIEACLAEGQEDQAIELLNEIEALPADEAGLLLAGKSYAAVGGVEDGMDIVRSVIEANPANAEAHVALASIAHEAGDTKMAMKHFITANGLDASVSDETLNEAYADFLPDTPAVAEEPEVAVAVAVEEEPVAVAVAVEEEAEPEIKVVQTAVADPNAIEPSVVEAPRPLAPPDEIGAKTVSLASAGSAPAAKSLDDLANEKKAAAPVAVALGASAPIGVKAAVPVESAPVLEVVPEAEIEYDPELEEEARHIAEAKEESKSKLKAAMLRDRFVSLSVALVVLIGLAAFAAFVAIAIPRDVAPSLVAVAAPSPEDTQIDHTTLDKTEVVQAEASATMPDVISAVGISNVAMPTMAIEGDISAPAQDIGFAPSMSFSTAESSMTSMMMFGQEIEGEVLGVILDVSGSMAEYLPAVISEVDRNFKNAPIVFINNALIMRQGKDGSIYPIVAEEVMPHWPKEWEKGNSPYWFLWHDLPRKAPERTVERIIKTFKERPNMFIARGNGKNRLQSAANFLAEQKCDSLYIFSDFEDFVDEEVAAEIGASLGRRKMRTYVQPAAMESEHLNTVHNKIARRTLGKKLPPLADLLRPQSEEKPIAVVVEEPTPVPDGVVHATRRPDRTIDRNYGYWGHRNNFKDEIKVFEYERFDLVLHGPEARAYLYLKTKDGYIQRPVVFGYHSRKYTKGTDDRWHWHRRKFLRHIEEPKLEGNEFVWNMMLEDEVSFKVIFWFKDDTATGTYVAEIPDPETNERGDDAHIFFIIPPIARENKDMYFGPDYPADGLTLDDTRIAVSDNRAIFHLPGTAADRYEKGWENLGFKRGHNVTPFNVIYRDLPDGVREVTVQGPSFADLALHARTTSNRLLLHTRGFRADTELWEGFVCALRRPQDRRERFTKTEAIEFSVDLRED